jgi:hypothetical protein
MARRAHLVRLTAPDESWVRRGALLLEDALRTASIPGVGPGRTLLVRHLDVGTIYAGRSTTALSVAIEERLRLLRATAVYAASAGARHAQAVYFHDEIEAFTLLALRMARHQPTDAWFWRLVMSDIDRREPLRSLVRFMAELAAHDALDPVLGALTESDGPALLAAMRWSRPADVPDSLIARLTLDVRSQAGSLPPAWLSALRIWVGRWGRHEPRTVWLAGITLAAVLPARMMDPTLPHRANILIAHIVGSDPALAQHATITGPDGEPDSVSDASKDDLAARQIVPHDPHLAPDRQPDHAASVPPAGGRAPGSAEVPTLPLPPDGNAPMRTAGEDTDLPETPDGNRSPELMGVPGLALPPMTAIGGLFFLVPVLERLGFSGFLAQHPQWIEAELGWAVLREAAFGLPLPESDPLRVLCEERASVEPDLPYVCPAHWGHEQDGQPGIAVLETVILHRVAEQPFRRVLLDGTGELPLAAWIGRAPPAVRHLLIGSRISTGPPLAAVPALARAWLLAAQRWLSRDPVSLDLTDLIARRGLFSATRTHIDIFFDHNQTDLRVRRLGLDFDPGWVPWLGRVVNFHYSKGVYGSQTRE